MKETITQFDFETKRHRDLMMWCFKQDCIHDGIKPIIIPWDMNCDVPPLFGFSVISRSIEEVTACLQLAEVISWGTKELRGVFSSTVVK